MAYNVYRIAYGGMPRDHHAIFVETNSDETGWLFQVVGNIQEGMRHDDKPAKKPEDSTTFQERTFIGTVTVANFDRIKPICESIPPPKKQFHGPRRLYPQEPIRRCQEWTKEAIDALVEAQVLNK